MKDKIRNIQKKAEESRYVPTVNSTLRALVSAIPGIGSSLDHLLFDKANEIRIRNIEKSIKVISRKVNQIGENYLNAGWFESTEAIEMFKQLIDKIQFEQDEDKSSTLSKIYALSGSNNYANDPNKFAVLRKVSELTTIQIKLLQIIEGVQPMQRQFQGNSLTSTATSIWFNDIKRAVEINPEGQFWQGTLQLDVEIEIIESLNLLRKIYAPLANIRGYEISGFGRLVLKYINNAN